MVIDDRSIMYGCDETYLIIVIEKTYLLVGKSHQHNFAFTKRTDLSSRELLLWAVNESYDISGPMRVAKMEML